MKDVQHSLYHPCNFSILVWDTFPKKQTGKFHLRCNYEIIRLDFMYLIQEAMSSFSPRCDTTSTLIDMSILLEMT
jgi:hypothetical protein